MPRRKKTGPPWFKMWSEYQHVFNTFPDESVGKALKLATNYLATGELPDSLEPMTQAVFNMFKMSVDESFTDHQNAVQSGLKGAQSRYRVPNPPYSNPEPRSPTFTEVEVEEDVEGDVYVEGDVDVKDVTHNPIQKNCSSRKLVSSINPVSFSPPTREEVERYFRENKLTNFLTGLGLSIDSEVQRFLDINRSYHWSKARSGTSWQSLADAFIDQALIYAQEQRDKGKWACPPPELPEPPEPEPEPEPDNSDSDYYDDTDEIPF